MRNMRVGKRARLARYSAHCDRISAIATADAAIITPEPARAAARTASFPAPPPPPPPPRTGERRGGEKGRAKW